MKIIRRVIAVLLGVVLMVSATMTRAQTPPEPHFVFTVPVRLVNVGNVTYRVACMVYDASGAQMARGIKQTDFTGGASGGAVDTDVVVNVSVRATTTGALPPANATNYQCYLTLYIGGSVLLHDDHTTSPFFPLSFGAPFIPVVSGTIPP